MKFRFFNKNDKIDNGGLVIVIDVIRAFTTAAYAFSKGAEKIILVKEIDEALSLKEKNPEYLLMGEKDGFKIDGFNFSNSPYEISLENLAGKTIVQRTSNGTAGVCNNVECKNVIVGSFVVAEAIVEYIKKNNFENINFVVTNDFRSSDDLALGAYICEKLLRDDTSPSVFLDMVKQSRHANGGEHMHREDMKYVLDLDRFNFVMKVEMMDGLPVLKKI